MFITDALASGMKELGERSGGSFVLDEGGALLVGRQLAKNSGSDPLDVLYLVVQKLETNRTVFKTSFARDYSLLSANIPGCCQTGSVLLHRIVHSSQN